MSEQSHPVSLAVPSAGLTTPQPESPLSVGRSESHPSSVSIEGDGSLKAAPSKSRVIVRPGSRSSYSLTLIDAQKRYTLIGLSRALGCSEATVRRMKLRTVTGPHGEKKYLGQHVIEALRGSE
jgi:hypothetical protein